MDNYQTRRRDDDTGWRERACGRCGATVRYHRDWDEPPELCRRCAEREAKQWREKVCPRCGTAFRYHREWDSVPAVCSGCREREQRMRGTKRGARS